MTDNQ